MNAISNKLEREKKVFGDNNVKYENLNRYFIGTKFLQNFRIKLIIKF